MRKFIFFALALMLAPVTKAQEWDIQLPDYEVTPAIFSYAGQNPDWGMQYLKSAEFWSKSRGQNAIIFIGDTGIDVDHPDLKDRIILEYCRDFTSSPNGFRDAHGHGTHCAGIAASSDNDFGVVGNAPQAALVSVKVLNNGGSGNFSWVAAMLRYVADLPLTGQHAGKRKVVSLSLGGSSGTSDLEAAINYAISKGVFIVAAAGNSGCNVDNTCGFPGRYPQIVCVGSIGKTEQPSGFSSCCEQLDVCAPGEAINSTGIGGAYVHLSGTSMATPGVAGVIANIVSAYPQIKTQSELENFLRKRAKDLQGVGWDKRTGYGSTVMTGYLTPPDGTGPPTPPTDPIRSVRTITIPVPGQYAFIWKASNETSFHRAVVTGIVADVKSNRYAEKTVKDAVAKTDGFFSGGSRGIGLLDNADLYDAGAWAAYFLALVTRDADYTIIVRSMTVQDEIGNTICVDWTKDKPRDLPTASALFHSRASKKTEDLKRTARSGATTFVK